MCKTKCLWKRKTPGINPESMFFDGGAEGDRTLDLLHAMEALSQLSYSPKILA